MTADPAAEAPFVFVLPEAERYSPDGGGAIATVTHELVVELLRAGGAATVVSPRFRGRPHEAHGVVVLPHSGDQATSLGRLARRALARAFPQRFAPRQRYVTDVLHELERMPRSPVVVANDPALAALLAADARRTVVLWLHNYLQGAEIAELRLVPPSVRMVAVSESVRRWTVDTIGVPAEQVSVIYNAVNRDIFFPADPLPRRRGELEVVCHGRIDPNKGQVLAARAVALARADGFEGIRLTIVGGGLSFGHPAGAQESYERELREAAERAGATFGGRVPADEVGSWLRRFDVALVLPLAPEPFGLVAVEAMASGCVVVAVPNGGVAEVVGDTALLVDPEAEQVAEALERLARDEGLRRELRARALRRAASFSWADSARRLVELVRADEADRTRA